MLYWTPPLMLILMCCFCSSCVFWYCCSRAASRTLEISMWIFGWLVVVFFCFCFFVIWYVCRSLAHLGSPASVSSLDKQHKHNRVNACIGTYARAKGMPTHKYTSSHRDGVVRWRFCPLFTRSLSPFVGFCDMRSFSFTRYNTKHTLPTIQFFVNIFFVARSFSLYLCRSFSSYLFLVVVVVAFVVACILNDIMSIFMYLCVLRSRIRFCVLEFQCCAHTNVSMCGWVCLWGQGGSLCVCVFVCMISFFFINFFNRMRARRYEMCVTVFINLIGLLFEFVRGVCFFFLSVSPFLSFLFRFVSYIRFCLVSLSLFLYVWPHRIT